MICAFTGHRHLRAYGFNSDMLDAAVHKLIKEGVNKFLCGMACGFDIEAAQSVLFFKKHYDIKLVACVPCANQTDTFPEKEKLKYEEILSACDEVITLAPYYYDGCMQARNRYMVDNCDMLLCFLREPRGGTFYTVNYAKRAGKRIVEI